MLDRHVGPRPGVDEDVAATGLEHRLERRALPRAHAHLGDHVIAGLRLQASTGAAPHVPRTSALASARPSKSGAFRVRPGEPGSTRKWTCTTITPARAADLGEPANVLDHVLLAGVLRRAALGERAAVGHDVVLHVLDDEGAPRGVEGRIRWRSVAPPVGLAAAVEEAERARATGAGAARGPEEAIRGPARGDPGPRAAKRAAANRRPARRMNGSTLADRPSSPPRTPTSSRTRTACASPTRPSAGSRASRGCARCRAAHRRGE